MHWQELDLSRSTGPQYGVPLVEGEAATMHGELHKERRPNPVAFPAETNVTESLAVEVRESGINVNCDVPGTLDTPQNRQAMPNAEVGRWVAPESLADPM